MNLAGEYKELKKVDCNKYPEWSMEEQNRYKK